MNDALRFLLMIFTAPFAGLREARERVPLGPLLALAGLANLAYLLVTQWRYWVQPFSPLRFLRYALAFAAPLLLLALVLAPLLILLANLLEKRGAWRDVLRAEYAATTACLFYVWAAACLWALPWAALQQATGWREQAVAEWLKMVAEQRVYMSASVPPGQLPRVFSLGLALLTVFPFFAGGLWAATREVFRFSWMRSFTLVAASLVVGYILLAFTLPFFVFALTSPLAVVPLFLLLRFFYLRAARKTQAQDEFQQKLAAAESSPRDALVQYSLGLVYLGRNQLGEAQASFARAVKLDPEEINAHYQLGRIARAQDLWAEAIAHFEQVARRDETHARHELWREIGATYLAAQQPADARAMLERFLEERPNDPQGLYLLGRAHAGLGAKDAARAALQACVEAVKTAPARQNPADQRWLNEAQQFLRSLA